MEPANLKKAVIITKKNVVSVLIITSTSLLLLNKAERGPHAPFTSSIIKNKFNLNLILSKVILEILN